MNPIVVIGTVAFDSIKTPFGEQSDILGGSATYFAMAARLFTPVQLVAIVGKDFPRHYMRAFENNGIDLEGLVRSDGLTFRWKGEYEENMNIRHTLETQLNVLDQFEAELPESYRTTPYVFLANINPDLQMKVLDQLTDPKLICCDTMNLWIVNQRKDLKEVLERIDFLIISEEEAQMLTKQHNIVRGAQDILKMGPFSLIIKRGGYGAVLFTQHRQIFAIPAYPLENVIDPTGAGDTFAGGFLGYLASRDQLDLESIQRAMVYGNITASFAVESFGTDDLSLLSRDKVRNRLSDFLRMTHLSPVSVHVD